MLCLLVWTVHVALSVAPVPPFGPSCRFDPRPAARRLSSTAPTGDPERHAAAGKRRPVGLAPTAPAKAPTNGELAADLTRFKGLAAKDVTAALGDPNFRRREAPAEIWQYFGASCVLDLFLYEDNGAQRVAHVELRSRTLGQGAQRSCLSQLLDGKRGQQAS